MHEPIPSRQDLDDALDQIVAYIAGSTEGNERQACEEAVQLHLAGLDAGPHAAHVRLRLAEVRTRYGLDR